MIYILCRVIEECDTHYTVHVNTDDFTVIPTTNVTEKHINKFAKLELNTLLLITDFSLSTAKLLGVHKAYQCNLLESTPVVQETTKEVSLNHLKNIILDPTKYPCDIFV